MADERDAIAQDDRLQVDPETHEGPAGFGRIAITLVGAAVIIGLVFFGLAQHRAERESAASGSPSSSAPPATAQNTAPTTANPADQPATAARGPSSKEQAQQQDARGANTGRGSGATAGNTGQAPAATGNKGQTAGAENSGQAPTGNANSEQAGKPGQPASGKPAADGKNGQATGTKAH